METPPPAPAPAGDPWPSRAAAEVAHDLAHTLQDTVLALAHLRAALRQRDAAFARELGDQLTTAEASLAANVALLHTLAAAGRPDAAPPDLDLRPVDGRQLAQAVIRQLRARAVARRVALALAPSPPLPPITCDPALLARALLNLVGNAIAAAGAARPEGGGRVTVALEQDGPQVRIAVADNGPGLPAPILAQLAQLAQPAQRAPAEPRLGLGLAFAHRVAAAHPQGALTIRTAAGAGATVTLAIAAADSAPPRERALGAREAAHG